MIRERVAKAKGIASLGESKRLFDLAKQNATENFASQGENEMEEEGIENFCSKANGTGFSHSLSSQSLTSSRVMLR